MVTRMPDDNDKTTVVSFNQSGGITAHTVNVSSRVQARRLSPEQFGQLSAALKGMPKAIVEIECPLASGADAIGYADDIRAALTEAGWSVRDPYNSTRAPVTPGIELVQRNRGPAMQSTQAVFNAFQSIGVVLAPLYDTQQELPENHLRICIGPNPNG